MGVLPLVLATGAGAVSRQNIGLVITTGMTFATSTDKVWDGLLFYEEIDSQPPTYLRLLLPIPIRTEGKISKVGSIANDIGWGAPSRNLCRL